MNETRMSDFKVILQDDENIWKQLLPLTFTRPISSLRIGIDTIEEKWADYFQHAMEIDTIDYLMPKFQNSQPQSDNQITINSSVLPNDDLFKAIQSLNKDEVLVAGDTVLAKKHSSSSSNELKEISFNNPFLTIEYPWDIFSLNAEVLAADFTRKTKGKTSQPISSTNQVRGKEQIFIEEGARVENSILNAENGPIYIGKNSTVLEGCMIREGLALCEAATLKMGAKVYGATTIGPHCKIGGEVKNIIMQAYSNKGHEGYLGNAVIGEWCNLGADTNASNMKNNYGMVKAFNYGQQKLINTGKQFVGLVMGDHSKCSINTMFNTATVVGVAANIFGNGFPPKHVPSFSWGGIHANSEFRIDKMFEMAENMMKRREITLTDVDKAIFNTIFENTKPYRKTRL